MAEDRLFVSEVNSDMRGENFSNLLKRYAWVLGALVVGVVAFVGYSTYKSSANQTQGVEQFNAIQALDSDPQDANAMTVLENSPSAISILNQVEVKRANGDIDGAKVLLEVMTNNSDYSQTMRDFAKLQLASINDGDGAQVLAQPGQTFALQAKLLEVDQMVANGQTDDALIALEALLANANAQSERAFIESLVLALGGTLPDTDDQTLPAAQDADQGAQNEE